MIRYIGITLRQFFAELICRNVHHQIFLFRVANHGREELEETNVVCRAKHFKRTKNCSMRNLPRRRNPHGMLAIIHQEKRTARKSASQGRRNGSR